MPEQMTSTIALKHENGVSFGTVDWFRDDKIQCQVAARIAPGSIVEMRMELAGWKHTLYAVVQVAGMVPSPKGDAPRYGLRIVEMGEDDRNRMEAWQQEQNMGGTTANPMARVSEEMEDLFAVKEGAASAEDTRVVMERYEERRRRVAQDEEIPDPFGLGTEGEESDGSGVATDLPAGPGTGSLSDGAAPGWLDQLERQAAQRAGREYTPREEERLQEEIVTRFRSSGQRLAKGAAPSWLAAMEQKAAERTDRDWEQRSELPKEKHPVVADTAPLPPEIPAPDPPQTPAPASPLPAEDTPKQAAEIPRDPAWALKGDQLEVQWTARSALQEDWDRGLSKGTLTLPEGLLPPDNPSVRLRLSLPDGQLLVIRGSFTPPSTASFPMTMALRHKLKTALGG
jgi:hypothetical protein